MRGGQVPFPAPQNGALGELRALSSRLVAHLQLGCLGASHQARCHVGTQRWPHVPRLMPVPLTPPLGHPFPVRHGSHPPFQPPEASIISRERSWVRGCVKGKGPPVVEVIDFLHVSKQNILLVVKAC